jgi:hypothetical protein
MSHFPGVLRRLEEKTMKRWKHFFFLAAASIFLAGGYAAAQEKETKESKDLGSEGKAAEKKVDVHELTIYPAAETKPALRDHLLPSSLEQTPQNAAPLYYRSLVMITSRIKPEDVESLDKWLRKVPIDELPVAEVREFLGRYHAALEEAHLAARRERCEWDLPVREVGPDLFTMLLPDVQELRRLGRLLALKARLQIAEGKREEALQTLRTMFALSRHVAQQPFLISGLVGMAISNQAFGELEQFLQAKDAPNMYWPLTNLPHPLIDLEPGLHLEYSAVYRVLPELQDARTGDFAAEEWDRRAARLLERFRSLVSLEGNPEEVRAWKDASDEEVLKKSYEVAKANLLKRGHRAAEIDKMPRSHAVLLDIAEGFDEVRDDTFKAFGLPYPQAQQVLEEAERKITKNKPKGVGGQLAALFLPSMRAVKRNMSRSQVKIDALRCIEALRMHAAAHGELPARLDDVTVVPIPINQLTGKSFSYRLEDGVATLDLEDDERPTVYRIRLAK